MSPADARRGHRAASFLATPPGGAAAFGPPRRLAGYQLRAVLAHGRRSIVYLAQEPQRGRSVAIKVAQRAHLEAMGSAADFGREFTLLSALAHPNVIRAFDHGVSGDKAFLSMEHAVGGQLAPYPGRAGSMAAASLLGQAASALARLHANGWVHRDVKPANILMRADGSLALADFGCACRQGETDPSGAGAVVGTPKYAAPEQSQGAAAAPAADVYSLGVLLYEILSGAPPYPGKTLTELLGQHLLAPVPTLPPQHRAWQPLLDSMLAKDPCQRLADGQAVLEKLQHLQHSVLPPIGPGWSSDARDSS